MHTPPDWPAIHGTEYVLESNCWLTCGGGACCKTAIPGAVLRLIPSNGAVLAYMEAEYAHLLARGLVPAVDGSKARRLSLPLGDGQSLSVITLFCDRLGRCDGVFPKPLHCRLYPFAPVFDDSGEVVDTVPLSVIDLAEKRLSGHTTCTIHRDGDHWLSYWRAQPAERLAPLRHPYVAFHLAALSILMDSYARALNVHSQLEENTAEAFWMRWEILYLSGELMDWDRIRQDIRALHDRMTAKHGAFIPLDAASGLGG